MSPTQLSVFALALGLIVGAAVTLAVIFALRARDRFRQETSEAVPDGITTVLAGLDDAAAVVDSSFLFLATSNAADWLGFKAGSTLSGSELRSLVRAARKSGVSEQRTMRLRIGDVTAESRLVQARATLITPRLTLLIVRDISEAERLQQMRQDFVANTSHELKTPVAAIMLLSEAIDMAAEDPTEVREFSTRLQAEAQRLGGLTNRIMNLSKLQSIDVLAQVRDVSVDEIVTAAVDSQSVAAASANVQLVRGGARGVTVRGDGQILTDAISNLVANAIAYSPANSRVGIGIKRVDDVIEIAVSDQGIGIAEEDQQRIFERFYRADQARSRRTGGTGLGLSIVKHAVQRHGGDVRVWSRPGRGSTFTIVLPTAHDDDERSKKKRKRDARAAKAVDVTKSDAAPAASHTTPPATPAGESGDKA